MTDRQLLRAALAKAGDRSALARVVGVDRVTIWRWLRDQKVHKRRDRRFLEQYVTPVPAEPVV